MVLPSYLSGTSLPRLFRKKAFKWAFFVVYVRTINSNSNKIDIVPVFSLWLQSDTASNCCMPYACDAGCSVRARGGAVWCPDILTVCLQPNHMKSLITLLASTSTDLSFCVVWHSGKHKVDKLGHSWVLCYERIWYLFVLCIYLASVL